MTLPPGAFCSDTWPTLTSDSGHLWHLDRPTWLHLDCVTPGCPGLTLGVSGLEDTCYNSLGYRVQRFGRYCRKRCAKLPAEIVRTYSGMWPYCDRYTGETRCRYDRCLYPCGRRCPWEPSYRGLRCEVDGTDTLCDCGDTPQQQGLWCLHICNRICPAESGEAWYVDHPVVIAEIRRREFLTSIDSAMVSTILLTIMSLAIVLYFNVDLLVPATDRLQDFVVHRLDSLHKKRNTTTEDRAVQTEGNWMYSSSSQDAL